MRGLSAVLSMGALTLVLVGCQTITEELPTQPTTVVTVGGQPQPIVVVPVQLPSPTAPAPESTPRPIPTAEPGGIPNNPGTPNTPGTPGQIPNNNNQVTKLGAKVFFVECDGRQVPDSEFATEAGIGCRVHLDVTPKDASNQPTRTKQTPHWSFSNESIIKAGNRDDFTPTFLATGAGTVSCWAEADGVTSNTVTIRLH
jgi:hypothetical protein